MFRLTVFFCLLLIYPLTRIYGQTAATCPQRTVVVNVRDRHGRFVPDFPPSAFQAKVHGSRVTVQAARTDKVPHRIVVLLDTSASVGGSSHTWELARIVAGDLLAAAGTTHGIALITFATKVNHTVDFSHSASEILQWLHGSDVVGSVPKGQKHTALLDAILAAAQLLGNPLPGDAIYAITDGGDNASQHHEKEVSSALLAKGIRFFAFYVTQSVFPGDAGGPGGSGLLFSLSQYTGGSVLDIPHTTGGVLYDLSQKGKASSKVNSLTYTT